jgi:sterol desaturase/sphingolipid hydroxylase (fatty acid hydroxylase superfamily)
MPEWMLAIGRGLEIAVGWIFSPTWLPPRDFDLLGWMLAPFGLLFITLAVLEVVIPQQRRPWSRSTLLTGMYVAFSAKIAFYAFLVAPALRQAWLGLGLPSLHLDRVLPLPLYFPIAMLVVTFTAYWSHRLMHRVPLFWHFHKVHHAAENLSFASTRQAHVCEELLHTPTHVLATLALGTDFVAPFGLAVMAIDMVAHANIRLDPGRLTYVVCTPQAHRIHHSLDHRHYDTNFGNAFMLWDHVFGTFCYDPADAPTAYGITEPLPRSFWLQQVLPFVHVARDAAAALGRRRPAAVPDVDTAHDISRRDG